MRLIELEPLNNGAHRNQETSFEVPIPDGWAEIPSHVAIPESFPFVDVVVIDEVITELIPRVIPDIPEVHEPSELEKMQAENKLFKAQLQAQSDRADFIEDCIAEMATQVYGGV